MSWRLLNELEDPDLQDLACRLPNTVFHSRADSTVKKYLGAYCHWKQWTVSHNIQPVPIRPHEFALYLQHNGETMKAKANGRGGVQCNIIDLLSYRTLLSAHSPLGQGYPQWRKRISLWKCWRWLQEIPKSRIPLRLAMAGGLFFLHFSEIVGLHPCDFTVMKIKIIKSKTEQLR